MTHQEDGSSFVGSQEWVKAVFPSPIVVHRLDEGQRCLCGCIEVHPTGEQFVALQDGIQHHSGVEWQQITDFSAILDPGSLDTPLPTVRIAVKRRGAWHYFEVLKTEFHSMRWVARCLGAEAAASVTNGSALAKAIILFGFVRGECKGCRRES